MSTKNLQKPAMAVLSAAKKESDVNLDIERQDTFPTKRAEYIDPVSEPQEGDLDLTRTSTNPSPYYALPLWRKSLITFALSFTALAATMSSTSLFSVVSEVSTDLHTSASAVTLSNAGVLLTMGFSSFIWAPISRLIGRKWSWVAASTMFMLCTIGASLVRDVRWFTALRIIGGLQGTWFHVCGQAVLAGLFEPIQRGTATGFFLAGTSFGPPFGPFVAGVIVTLTTWRAVLWLQAIMMALGLMLSILFLPALDQNMVISRKEAAKTTRALEILKEFDFLKIFRPMIFPNVLFTDLTCGLLSWSQYTLLAAPRHILATRFHVGSPLIAGLFYIAPGCGFMLGTIVGGRWSDLTVRKWIQIRKGQRLPQDRLRSGMIAYFGIIPIFALIYGWALEFDAGGLPLPITTIFFCSVGLLVAFASVNTYCAEVFPRQRTEVIAGKYLIQYTFAAIGSATIVPLIDLIGVGLASTIGVILVLIGGALTFVTAKHGLTMQLWMVSKLKQSSTLG